MIRKFFVSFVFAFLLFILCGASGVYAATYGDLTYEISNGEVTITDCKETAKGEIVIPDKLGGYPVTKIGNDAFGWCQQLTAITIPNNVTSIGDDAFGYCSGLTSITIPDGVTSIGRWAFYYCSGLTSITIPNSVTTIGEYAFSDCNKLTSITIPDSVTTIDKGTFSYCTSLTSITIPNSVTTIGECAFSDCSKLTSITIPDSITTIDKGTFSDCTSLTSIAIPDGVVTIDMYAFSGCSKLTSVIISYSVTAIWDYAFSDCTSLKSITIPDSVTAIWDCAFSDCTSLKSITIPDSVTYISFNAFYGCNLETVYKHYSATWDCDFGDAEVILYVDNYLITYMLNGKKIATERLVDGVSPKLLTPPYGYTYSFSVNGEDWNGESITEDVTVTVTKTPITYTITYVGDYTGEAKAKYLTSATLPIPPYGYTYTYAANGTEWDGIVKGNQTVTVTKTPITYTITYVGDYTGEAKAEYLSSVTFPEAPYGYTYSFTVNGTEWDGTVSGNHTVTVTKVPVTFTITYVGDYTGEAKAEYLTSTPLPVPPYGYTYSFTSNGEEWNGESITEDVTVTVTKTPITYTITYVGDYTGEAKAEYLTGATLPIPPYGYTYTYAANGTEWDGIVKGNQTVTVTKTPITYTITYVGDYTGEAKAEYLTSVTFPEAPYGYTYSFTVNGTEWDGTVSGNQTVNVTKVPVTFTITYVGDYAGESKAKYLTSATLPIPPHGYTYTYSANGTEWDGIVKGNQTVNVTKIPLTFTITYVGDYTGEAKAEYLTSVTFPEAPYGYTYSFTVNGTEWDGTVRGNHTVTVTKVPVTFTITYVGDYAGESKAKYLTSATLPIPPHGYTYTYAANGTEWDGIVKGNQTVNVTKIPLTFTITYVGDYTGVAKAEYLTSVILPTPQYGYTYSFTVNGTEWDGTVRGNHTVNVTKIPVTFTITYVGDYTGEAKAEYLTSTPLPVPPYGYTYSFTANSEEWNGESITEDVTVTVTKTPITYTITYVGDYTGEAKAEYLTGVTLPSAPEGYIYIFTEGEITWSGESITKDATIDVNMLCDMAELEITNIEDASVVGNEIRGKYYGRKFVPECRISPNATITVYTDAALSEKVDSVTLQKGINTFYAGVTAESGRKESYTIIIDRAIPETLGELTVVQTVGGNLTMQVGWEIKGAPSLYLYYGYSIDYMTDYAAAEYIKETDTIFAGGLPEDTDLYIKIVAIYDECRAESTVVRERTGITLSSDCYIIRTLTPPGGRISHGSSENDMGEISGLTVTNKFEDIVIDVEVSKGATWGLYRTASSSTEISKTVSLNEGRTVTRYIKVTSEDGEHRKIYSVSIYRQSKSTQPVITVSGQLVTITAEENSTIIYTTDKTEPSENNGTVYTAPFIAQGGTIVKAIARQSGKDEYSDIVTCALPDNLDINIVPMDDEIYTNSKGYLCYAFNLEAPEAFSGRFVIALYDEDGRFICMETQTISAQTEYYAEGSIKPARTPRQYRAFLWSCENNIAPLTEMVNNLLQ